MTQHISVEQLKEQYPKLYVGSDEEGYTELSPSEYNAVITDWANNYPVPEKTEQELILEQAEAAAKRQALLDKLGITEDEAKLLLGGN
jgi:hypothetical protein